jgi:hypothetical protein
MHGNSFANGTQKPPPAAGWDIRPATHWDFTEGRHEFG